MSRTVAKLFLALALLLGAGSMSALPGTAQVVSCCYTCNKNFQTCETRCNGSNTCLATCSAQLDHCSNVCGGNCV
ncbi:MAG TPA: hypothetical protein VGG20_10430 [Thermoanaerobaculia bacterium]|jgi:hypothetical protein